MRVSPTHPCAGSPATAGVYEDVNVSAEIDGLGYMQGTAEAGGAGVVEEREVGVYPHSNTQADKKRGLNYTGVEQGHEM